MSKPLVLLSFQQAYLIDITLGSWTMLPYPGHWSQVPVAVGSSIVFVGIDSLHILDLTTQQFSRGLPMQHSRHLAAVVSARHKVYAIGGVLLEGYCTIAEVYDVHADQWRTLPSHPEPARSGMAAVNYNDDTLYLMGGCTGLGYSAGIHRLQLDTEVWDSVTVKLPSPNYLFGATQVNQQILVAGGLSRQAYLWDVADSFTAIGEMPEMECVRVTQLPVWTGQSVQMLTQDMHLLNLSLESGEWVLLG
jgi:hypothetical protein